MYPFEALHPLSLLAYFKILTWPILSLLQELSLQANFKATELVFFFIFFNISRHSASWQSRLDGRQKKAIRLSSAPRNFVSAHSSNLCTLCTPSHSLVSGILKANLRNLLKREWEGKPEHYICLKVQLEPLNESVCGVLLVKIESRQTKLKPLTRDETHGEYLQSRNDQHGSSCGSHRGQRQLQLDCGRLLSRQRCLQRNKVRRVHERFQQVKNLSILLTVTYWGIRNRIWTELMPIINWSIEQLIVEQTEMLVSSTWSIPTFFANAYGAKHAYYDHKSFHVHEERTVEKISIRERERERERPCILYLTTGAFLRGLLFWQADIFPIYITLSAFLSSSAAVMYTIHYTLVQISLCQVRENSAAAAAARVQVLPPVLFASWSSYSQMFHTSYMLLHGQKAQTGRNEAEPQARNVLMHRIFHARQIKTYQYSVST